MDLPAPEGASRHDIVALAAAHKKKPQKRRSAARVARTALRRVS
jgi:hypothetical protein